MNIALDYDGTFTKDPYSWCNAMDVLKLAGHRVIGVTMRRPSESTSILDSYFAACDTVIYTSRRGKRDFVKEAGIVIDVWIDDTPEWVLYDAIKTDIYDESKDKNG